MNVNVLGKNKKIIATMVSLTIGIGASCFSQASVTTEDKGGSFKYVVPAGGDTNDKCPGPYESMAVTFINNTTTVTPGHGEALTYNIYYVVNDDRAYIGNHAYPEDDQITFPTESASIKDAEYATGNTSWSYYGPIEGTYVNAANTLHTPIHAGPTGPLRTTSTLQSLQNKYGDDAVKVITAYNKKSNVMDWNSSGNNTITVRLPLRNYKRLLIEVRATDVSIAKQTASKTWNDSQQSSSAGAATSIFFDAEVISKDNGSLVEILAYRPYSNGFVYSHELDVDPSNSVPMTTLPLKSTLNLRTVDELVISNKGHDNHHENNPVPSGFYSGSDVTIKYLKDKTTGQTISCD